MVDLTRETKEWRVNKKEKENEERKNEMRALFPPAGSGWRGTVWFGKS